MRWYEPTPKQQSTWNDWVKSLPPISAAVCSIYFPWELYTLPDERIVTVEMIHPSTGILAVRVLSLYNPSISEDVIIAGVDSSQLSAYDGPIIKRILN